MHNLADCRIIMIQNALPKLLERSILYILKRDCPSMLEHHIDQAGFVPGKSTSRQLLRLRLSAEQAKKTRSPLTAVFLDIRKAFDTIPIKWLLKIAKIKAANLKSDSALSVVSLLERWYSTPMFVRTGREEDPVGISRAVKGVPQGGVLSPWLFNLGLDTLLCSLQEVQESHGIQTMAFADDLCILGKDEESLQKSIDLCENWIACWGGSFAPGKCESVNFVGSKHHCLGRVIDERGLAANRLSFEEAPLQSLFKPRKGLTTELLCQAEQSLNWSTILYSCEVFPLSEEDLKNFQRSSLPFAERGWA
eukprot:GHVP01057109.1.p1 GENE.GHVP01057109.1~~GHVP01057109.1.p1  ORF type:complete len:307 (+),score=42.00 GHVP01057109.1:1595-2515(+)